MEIVIAVTLFLTFGAFLILPHLEAPPIFPRLAIGLCASEFVGAVGWGMATEGCRAGDASCGGAADMWQRIVGLEIPALTAAVFVVATAYGVFVARRW
jgi:hypothetical protein